jgi:hypothetical protein
MRLILKHRSLYVVLLISAFALAMESIGIAQDAGTFTATGSMNVGRWMHTATLLKNGKVLITGGATNGSYNALASAELYDPVTGTFSITGSMSTGRSYHTATLLPNGKVLIAGGWPFWGGSPPVSTAEIYDPDTGSFSLTGSMTAARSCHAATILHSGNVLIVGTQGSDIYDFASGTFYTTPNLRTLERPWSPQVVLLSDGQVLVTGGGGEFNGTAELYDPGTDSYVDIGPLSEPRQSDTSVLLADGRVLIDGGIEGWAADIYNPVTRSFTPSGGKPRGRYMLSSPLLSNGQVLLVGGSYADWTANTLAEIWDPSTGEITPTGSLMTARGWNTATLLTNGKVLVAGGFSGYLGEPYANLSAELYTPTYIPTPDVAGVWIGLKNSDDQGTQFDLRAEVYRNGTPVSSGETSCITGVTRNPALAKLVMVEVGSLGNLFSSGDSFFLKFLTRIGTNPDGTKCSGLGGSHSNAVGLRLYYDSVSRSSGVTLNPIPYFLHSTGTSFFLDADAPTGSVSEYKDSAAINFAKGNLWKEIGNWNMTVP